MKNYHRINFIILGLFILSSLIQTLSRNDQIRLKYYERLLENNSLINLVYDNQGLYLTLNSNLEPGNHFIELSHNFLIDGCVYYPFKEEINSVIMKIMNPDENSKKLKRIFLFAYQILYYKFANHEDTMMYYRDESESSVFRFNPTKENLEFINMIFKKIPSSVYTYDDEELELARNLDINLDTYEFLINSFNAVLSYTLNEATEEARVLN